MDNREEQKIRQLLEETQKEILNVDTQENTDVFQLFKLLEHEKDYPPHPVQEPETEITNTTDYKDFSEDGVSRIIGLDGSTTKTITMGTDAKVCISNCRLDINRIGSNTEAKYDFGQYSNITLVIYKKQDDFNEDKVDIIEEKMSDNKTQVNIHLVTDIKPNNANQYLEKTSIYLAESSMAKAVLEKTKELDKKSCLLLDGPIYPLGMIKNSYLTQNIYKNSSKWQNNLLEKIANNYHQIIETSIEQNTPVIGCVKNIDTRNIIKLLEQAKIDSSDIVWHNDEHFLSDLLNQSNKMDIEHTNWFEEKNEKNKTLKEELSSNRKDKYNEEHYERIHFYLKIPRKGSIIRVETVKGKERKRKERRDLNKKRILSEVSRAEGIPAVIKEADRKATINRNQRDKIRKQISNINNYNKERGYDD